MYLGSGLPTEYLEQAVRSALNQTHLPCEIVLSDDTTGNEVAKWLEGFEGNGKTPILHVRNTKPRGVSSNSNFGASHSTGDFIHFLHADDFIFNPNAYADALTELLKHNQNWLLFSGQTGEGVTIPSIQDLNLFGVNSVGGPSAIFVKREAFIGFDENLSMLMDIDFLIKMFETFGSPIISSGVSIIYGSGSWQIQQNTSRAKVNSELEHLWQSGSIDISTFYQLIAMESAWDLKRDALTFLWKTSRIDAFDYFRYRIRVEFMAFMRRIINRYNKGT